MPPLPRLRRHAAARRLLRARGGIAAVEFAIGAAFFVLALTALYDFGHASWRRLEIATASQAGAVYAAANGFNTNGIVAAVTSATSAPNVTASPAPSLSCGCPNGVAGITTVACGSTCPPANAVEPGKTAGYYITVHARGTYSFMFPYPFVSSPATMSATTVAKLQ